MTADISRKSSSASVGSKFSIESLVVNNGGLTVSLAAFFMVAQMAGAGFLALPKAMADAGWLGMAMIVLFGGSIGFSATRLGKCWNILEERWPKYKTPTRQPYLDISFQALGGIGRKLAMFCLLVTNIGTTIVQMSLMAELLNSLLPKLSICEWALIAAAVVTPATWLGSPKDFWQASVFAVVSTVLAVIMIVVKMIIDYTGPLAPTPEHSFPTVASFSAGFGAILFSYGGASVFPTIQNDMKNKGDFWKSVILAFSAILSLYVPVALSGYILIGQSVDTNILLSLFAGPVVTVAMVLQIFNLLGTYIITLSPVVQSLEESLNIPSRFGIKRIGLRTSLVIFELLIILAIPDFGLILNLVGGSTTCCLSFIFPPLMYMKLVADTSNKKWTVRTIPTWERIFLFEIMIAGAIGGVCSTVSGFFAILHPDAFNDSCFLNFGVHS